MSFTSLLIANRGEIAIRIARAARALGLRAIAVYSDADRDAPHVLACDDAVAIGGAQPADSYLRIDKLLDAARASGAQAVHPGYGFLAENAAFAQAVIDAGLIFVGPPPAAIAAMGDKAAARGRAAALGVPVLPGYDGAAQDDATFAREAQRIGYPLMIKAVAGGGGRGMRLVHEPAQLAAALAQARSEAGAAFGDDRLLAERALLAPRHVEIQLLADAHGRCVFLGERDCSIQRRHQKIVEEAPCPVLTAALRRTMGEAAVRLARAIGYVGAGTVEFLYEDGEFYFMEMNTRLQVEHPVTEAVAGVDLVQWQLRVAAGEPLPLAQDELLARFEAGGHAIEVRLCAEEPAADFMPRVGRIVRFVPPEDVRFDHALRAELAVTPFYDALLGKLIAHAPTRAAAAQRLAAALDRTAVFGVPTNRAYLARVLREADFLAGRVSTAYVAAHPQLRQSPASERLWALAAFVATRASDTDWPADWLGFASTGVRATPYRLACGEQERSGTVEGDARRARVGAIDIACPQPLRSDRWNRVWLDGRGSAVYFARAGARMWLQADGEEAVFDDCSLRAAHRASVAGAGTIVASMHGRVVQVAAQPGQRVAAGAVLLTLEAMKMEHALTAPAAGVVRAVHGRVGEQVAAGRVLVELQFEGDA
ncbi:MAG: biotin carboxylase N-terminal domain-containing protein [Pseudomonadota bacterium]